MFANQVDKAGNAFGIYVDPLEGVLSENEIGCSGCLEALRHISLRLLICERTGLTPHPHTLAELSNGYVPKLLFQLGLTGKHDLQELFRGGLEICQQPDFFEELAGKVLRFIDCN